MVKRVIAGEPVTVAWFRTECVPKISGAPPKVVAELGGTQRDGTVERDDVSR